MPGFVYLQLKQLFAYCGKVANVHFIGETRETALVEYTTALVRLCPRFRLHFQLGCAHNIVCHCFDWHRVNFLP